MHNWKKFEEEKFIFEFNNHGLDNIVVLGKEDVNETIVNFLQNLNKKNLKKFHLLKNSTSKSESLNKNFASQKN